MQCRKYICVDHIVTECPQEVPVISYRLSRSCSSISMPEPIHSIRAHVTSGGRVTVVNTYRYKVLCLTNTDPGAPVCRLHFASWSMDSDMITLRSARNRIDMTMYNQHPLWEMDESEATPSSLELPWDQQRKQTSQMTYHFTLRSRKNDNDEDDKDKDNGADAVTTQCLLIALSSTLVYLLSTSKLC